jgi:hypothetical protein
LISSAKAREELKWADGKVLKAELDMEVRDTVVEVPTFSS